MASLNRRSTFTSALWNVAAMVFPLVSTLLLSVVIGRRLGSNLLGQQSVIAYTGSLIGGLLVLAATNCTTQVLAAAVGGQDPGRFAALARLAQRVHLAGGLLAGLVLTGIGSFRELPWAWAMIGLVTFLDAVGWSHASKLIALDGWRSVSPLRLVSQLAGTLLGVGAVLLGGGLPGVFAAQVLSSGWLTVMLRRRDRSHETDLSASPTPLELRPLARLWSLYVVGVLLTQVVNKRIELVFLDAFGTAHDVAIYSVAFTVIGVAVTVPSSLVNAALPAITVADAAHGGTALRGHLQRAAQLAVFGGFLLAAALVAVGPSLIVALWGTDFAAAARILPWLAVSIVGVPLCVLLDVYWTATGGLAAVLVTGSISAAVDLGLAGALVPSLGVDGAVIANVGGQFAWLAGLLVYTQRRIPGVLPSVRDLLPLAARAAVVGAAAWEVTVLLGTSSAGLALVGGCTAVVAVLVLVGRTVGLLSAADLDWLHGLMPPAAQRLLTAVAGGRRAREAAAARHGAAPEPAAIG